MSNPKQVSRWVVMVMMVPAVLITGADYSATTSSDYGLGKLDEFLKNDPSQLCYYVNCQEPVSSNACPEGTWYKEGTSQFGCCGACVAFAQKDESCTGTIDPSLGGGYKSQGPTTDFLASLYNVTDNVVHSKWCDYGYQCFKNRCDEGTTKDDCRGMLNRYLYDIQDQTLYKYYRDDYRWKPNCTVDGKYEPKQCLGPLNQQRCVCMDPDGNRIYGLAFPEQEELFRTMNCMCSRQAWEKKQAGQDSVTLHCLENGNFEPLQCEDGWCYCINPDTAEPYGSRLSETAMHLLPCYNKTTTGEIYLRRCESENHAHAKLVEAMANTGVKGPPSLTACDQDGSYNSKQCDQTMCRCWDKYMADALSFPSGDDCQCARDQRYYTDTNSKISIACITNTGTYAAEQTQGTYKYCVDEDGIRAGPMVINSEEYTLDCGKSKQCLEQGANGTDFCSKACVVFSASVGSSECPDEAYAYYTAN